MDRFKPGDIVKRIDGINDIHLGMIRGNIYEVDRYHENGIDIKLRSIDGMWYSDNFELVKRKNSKPSNPLEEMKWLSGDR